MLALAEEHIHQRLHRDYPRLLDQTILSEGLLFPEIHRQFRDYVRQLDVDAAERQRHRLARLTEFLDHAASRVPAHTGQDSRQPLSQWPFMSKADIRDRLVDHCDDTIEPDTCRLGYTSGTTGIPIKIIHDFPHIVHKYALALRRNHAAGLPMRRRILMPMRDGKLPWLEYASPAHGNSVIVQFGSSDRERISEFVDRAAAFAPDVVYGHPSNCLMFLEELHRAGNTIRPRAVLTYGESLTPALRERLEAGFDTEVRDGYGLQETGSVAVQCDRGSYHVESERLVVEVVDEQGQPLPPGTEGEVVVTDLTNRALPFIRYRTGDSARLVPEGCACGYPGDILADIQGRTALLVEFPNGLKLPVNAVARILRRYPVGRFQIVRQTPGTMDVLITYRRRPWPRQVMDQLVSDLESYIENAGSVDVRVVGDDEFLQAESGKDTDYVSLI